MCHSNQRLYASIRQPHFFIGLFEGALYIFGGRFCSWLHTLPATIFHSRIALASVMDSSRKTSPTSSPSNSAVKLPTIIVTDTSREDAVKRLLARTSWLSFDQQFEVLEKFAKLEALLQLFGEDSWISGLPYFSFGTPCDWDSSNAYIYRQTTAGHAVGSVSAEMWNEACHTILLNNSSLGVIRAGGIHC